MAQSITTRTAAEFATEAGYTVIKGERIEQRGIRTVDGVDLAGTQRDAGFIVPSGGGMWAGYAFTWCYDGYTQSVRDVWGATVVTETAPSPESAAAAVAQQDWVNRGCPDPVDGVAADPLVLAYYEVAA